MSAWTGPPALLALLALLAFNILLNTTQKVKCHKDIGHLQSAFGQLTQKVDHLTRYPSCLAKAIRPPESNR